MTQETSKASVPVSVHRRLLLLTIVFLSLIPAVLKSRSDRDIRPPAAFPVSGDSRIIVRVTGSVRFPGIYNLAANNVTADAIMMAEPLKPCIDKTFSDAGRVNLSNGDILTVEFDKNGGVVIARGSMAAKERIVLKIPLDINKMSVADFDALPGIGPSLAKRIVVFRQNNGGSMYVKQLQSIEGIGEKGYHRLKKYF